mmetsp:Transcript_28150/g.42587  ORF Transcript_28150/g.42587 Transcript_28150/m.42587 type:complete len:248 (+) Transcript_28150:1379-2122(+)
MQMAELANYSVGGTVHVIANNQIGFTTTPLKGRSAMYSSDLAKAINAPIFHVNADSLEDVHQVFKAAAAFRQKFKQDVVIDLIGYRKYGHNELDQPSFTQPLMYKQVAKMTPVARIYEKQLLEEGVIDQAKVDEMLAFIRQRHEDGYAKSKDTIYEAEDWMTEEWEQLEKIDEEQQIYSGLPLNRLKDIGTKITTLPDDASFHRQVKKIFVQRAKTISSGKGIDWGTAEALAFASLIQDGNSVRISG